ncbi:jg3615 [Pararge aegeria aegeria]|uniref:Jg3615 protein n=1 Tax=Pararge aegeria aegeria TaxID=348720 RepID=A0A8S4R4N1_9NEOP|nr:jg3615 [Pararge aegeria aegeria]
MLRLPLTAKRTNISILEQLRVNTRLSTLCYKNILSYFGRIARRLPSNMDNLILVGRVGKRPRGLPMTNAIKKAEDRTGWKAVVKIATKGLESGYDLPDEMTFKMI